MKRIIICTAFAAIAASSGVVSAAPKNKTAAPPEEEAVAAAGVSPADRNRFARYLKSRLDKIQKFHQARMDFHARETEAWNSFWNKVRDERRQFEIRMARQTLGLFDSLASLDPKDHAITIADFDRMQGNVIKNFENSQREKLQGFFMMHEGRWRDFAAQQERERVEFMAEALSGWNEQKAYLKAGKAVSAGAERAGTQEAPAPHKSKATAAEAPEVAPEEEEAPKAKKAAKPRASPSKKSPVDQIENWN